MLNSGKFEKGQIPHNKGKKYTTGNINSKDITSKKYNRWTAIKRTEKDKNGYWKWYFECECGNKKELSISTVTSGDSKSCGCLKLEKLKIGHKHTEESKSKLSESHKGSKNPQWKGGITKLKTEISKLHLGIKSGAENHSYIQDRTKVKVSEKKHLNTLYKEWMKSVKNRDSWKCRIADINCNGRLEAHHILNWIDYPELRYDINNGITLCVAHHPRGRKKEAELSPYFTELVAEMNKIGN